MSIEIIKDQIFKFLSTDTPEVMAIKGEWGVGKTYSWKKFLGEANSNAGVALDRYSYVSLFVRTKGDENQGPRADQGGRSYLFIY